MASNMSILIESTEGPIEGEYLEKPGQIEVRSWSWDVRHTANTHAGPGGAQGELRVGDLTFIKPVDKSTPALLRMLVRGTGFKNATLTVRKASGGDATFDYVTITMLEGVVSSVISQGAETGHELVEEVKLNFPKWKYEYVTQETESQAAGSSVPMSWSIPEKKPLA